MELQTECIFLIELDMTNKLKRYQYEICQECILVNLLVNEKGQK